MKPTKKQIELSKRIWELGIHKFIDQYSIATCATADFSDGGAQLFKIWTLEDGLAWLEEHVDSIVMTIDSDGDVTLLEIWNTDYDAPYGLLASKVFRIEADTPTEAVLEACVKVAEMKEGK